MAVNSTDCGGDEYDNSTTSPSAATTNLGSTDDIAFVVDGALGPMQCVVYWGWAPLMFSDFACIVVTAAVVGG